MVHRHCRWFVVALAFVALTACGASTSTAPTPTATAAPSSTPTPTATPSPTAVAAAPTCPAPSEVGAALGMTLSTPASAAPNLPVGASGVACSYAGATGSPSYGSTVEVTVAVNYPPAQWDQTVKNEGKPGTGVSGVGDKAEWFTAVIVAASEEQLLALQGSTFVAVGEIGEHPAAESKVEALAVQLLG